MKYKFLLSLMGKIGKANVKVLAGSDFINPFVFPGFSLHEELQLMVEGGMKPEQALKAATYNPALFMERQDKYGSVDIGKVASLVLLNENPLVKIENTEKIEGVIVKGEFISRKDLDKLLLETKKFSKTVKSLF